MQFIIEPLKEKRKKKAKIKFQCPDECTEFCPADCYCFDPSCGGHELCMDGLNCPTWTGLCSVWLPCSRNVAEGYGIPG